jgi:Subtilase family
MSKKRVMVEFRHKPEFEAAVRSQDAVEGANTAARLLLPTSVDLDRTFAPVRLPGLVSRTRAKDPTDTGALFTLAMAPEASTYIMRGEVEESDVDMLSAQWANEIAGIFADPLVEPALVCPGDPPVGTDADVGNLLCARLLQRCGMDGRGVLVAIVDTGFNLAYLNAHGKHPNFDAARSFSVAAGVVPGSAPINHGTMCAFDVCIAAPRCTLLDIVVLQNQPTFSALLSDMVRAYAHLLGVMSAPRRPGDLRSMVVTNSWALFKMAADFPPGSPSNYSDNPNHPFNRAVQTLETAGADILFAAGNCGVDCPDGRCDDTNNTIRGANGHPAVLCVAGVDTTNTRVGYSSIGPGRLAQNKPDVCGYTHFAGSGVYAADGGTSAACPVVAGVVAAVRSKRPYNPASPGTAPAAIRSLITSSAHDLGNAGYDFATGFGVVDGCLLYGRFCGPHFVSDFCRRYPQICYPWLRDQPIRPFPLIPPLPDPPLPTSSTQSGNLQSDVETAYGMALLHRPIRPTPTVPDPLLRADSSNQSDNLQNDVEIAYAMGLLHGQQLASAGPTDTQKRPKPHGCSCSDGETKDAGKQSSG